MKATFTAASLWALALSVGLAAAGPALAQDAEAEDPRPERREDAPRAREDGPRLDRRGDAGFRAAPESLAPAEAPPQAGGRQEAWGRYGQPREVPPAESRPAPQDRRPEGDGRRDGDRQDRDRNDGRRRHDDRHSGHRYDGYRYDGYRYDGYRPDRYDRRHPPPRPPRYDPRWYPPVWTPSYRYRGAYWVPPPGFAPRRWTYGEVLPWTWWTPRYRIESWWNFGLPVPPVGFAWVRLGRDAVLVDLWTGRVVQVAFSLFW